VNAFSALADIHSSYRGGPDSLQEEDQATFWDQRNDNGFEGNNNAFAWISETGQDGHEYTLMQWAYLTTWKLTGAGSPRNGREVSGTGERLDTSQGKGQTQALPLQDD
jgi:hypothetical protein